MAISSIHDWLVGNGSFERGVELYKLHCEPDPALNMLFRFAESPFSRAQLREVLERTNQGKKAPVITGPKKKVDYDHGVHERAHVKSMTDPVGQVKESELPQRLKVVYQDIKKAWREKQMLRGFMVKTPDGLELRNYAAQIKALQQKIRAGWRMIEYWYAYGDFITVDETDEALDRVSLIRRRNALEVWLSQRRRGDRPATPELFLQRERELKDVRELLSKINEAGTE